MKDRLSYVQWQEERNEQDRPILEQIAQRLLKFGLEVHWSARSGTDLALVVNKKCLIRVGSNNKASGKFWYVEDKALKLDIQNALDSKIVFADCTFDGGDPKIGEAVSIN